MNYPDNCPHCDAILDNGDIKQKFIDMGNDEAEAERIAGYHGWTQKEPLRFSRIVHVKWQQGEGTSYYRCPDCEERIDV